METGQLGPCAGQGHPQQQEGPHGSGGTCGTRPPRNPRPQFPFSLSGRAALALKSHFFFQPHAGKIPALHLTQSPLFIQPPAPPPAPPPWGAGGHLRVLGVPHRKRGGHCGVWHSNRTPITSPRGAGRAPPAAPRPVPLPQSLSLPFPRRCHLPAAQACHRGCCVPWRVTLLSSLPGPPQPLRSPRAGLGSTPDIPQHQTQAPRPPSRDSQYLPVFPHDRQDLPGNPSAPPWLPGSSSDPRDSQFLLVSPNAPSTSQSSV